MIAVAMVILSVAAGLFVVRLLIGPTVPDRIIALDGLLIAVMSGILVAGAQKDTTVALVAVLLVALVGFVATGVVARYVERRGG